MLPLAAADWDLVTLPVVTVEVVRAGFGAEADADGASVRFFGGRPRRGRQDLASESDGNKCRGTC